MVSDEVTLDWYKFALSLKNLQYEIASDEVTLDEYTFVRMPSFSLGVEGCNQYLITKHFQYKRPYWVKTK